MALTALTPPPGLVGACGSVLDARCGWLKLPSMIAGDRQRLILSHTWVIYASRR